MFALAVLSTLAAFGSSVALAFTLAGLAVLACAPWTAETILFSRLALAFAFSRLAMFALAVLTALAFHGISKGEVRKRSRTKKYQNADDQARRHNSFQHKDILLLESLYFVKYNKSIADCNS